MTDRPGDHPEPPSDLNDCRPLIHELSSGKTVFRLHRSDRDPLFFGRTGLNRFDSPDGSFGALYAGMDEHCAFIETFGSLTGTAAVTGAFLQERHLAELVVLEPLRLIDLSSRGGLARLRADARLVSGSHAIAQRWSQALRAHPCAPDGLLYPARHDPARNTCVLFDSSSAALRSVPRGSLMAARNRRLLGEILTEYDFRLIE